MYSKAENFEDEEVLEFDTQSARHCHVIFQSMLDRAQQAPVSNASQTICQYQEFLFQTDMLFSSDELESLPSEVTGQLSDGILPATFTGRLRVQYAVVETAKYTILYSLQNEHDTAVQSDGLVVSDADKQTHEAEQTEALAQIRSTVDEFVDDHDTRARKAEDDRADIAAAVRQLEQSLQDEEDAEDQDDDAIQSLRRELCSLESQLKKAEDAATSTASELADVEKSAKRAIDDADVHPSCIENVLRMTVPFSLAVIQRESGRVCFSVTASCIGFVGAQLRGRSLLPEVQIFVTAAIDGASVLPDSLTQLLVNLQLADALCCAPGAAAAATLKTKQALVRTVDFSKNLPEDASTGIDFSRTFPLRRTSYAAIDAAWNRQAFDFAAILSLSDATKRASQPELEAGRRLELLKCFAIRGLVLSLQSEAHRTRAVELLEVLAQHSFQLRDALPIAALQTMLQVASPADVVWSLQKASPNRQRHQRL